VYGQVDMVINVGRLKSGDVSYVYNDIASVVTAARHASSSLLSSSSSLPSPVIVKVIIETALLTDEEKITACSLAVRAGADYVKTSTGFASGGAKVYDVTLMRRTVGPTIGVKASGSIRYSTLYLYTDIQYFTFRYLIIV
jgi:deoxyribose-phosphate aldolase